MFRSQLTIWCVLALIAVAGCGRTEQITQYTVPRAESIQLPTAKPTGSAATKAARPERMLGAIIPRGEQTWFFKLSGEPERVAERTEAFRQFVQSVRFGNSGNPQWNLPAGWAERAGAEMRFATIIVDAGPPPLELTVIALPSASGDPSEQILANVNRWRGQLSLPSIDSAALPTETETVTLASGSIATLVDYQGTSKPGGMTPPFASASGLNRPRAASTSSAGPPFTATVPSAWSAGKTSMMRKAAYIVEEGDQKAEITVIDLAREAGDRLANVNRWRGQVGLDPIDAEQLAKTTEPIDMGGLQGLFVELTGAEQTILGVIVDREEKTWFFKLQGDVKLAIAQKPRFEQYVRSVKWE